MMPLNDEQIAAVQHEFGVPAVVIAGAGAGKTSVLTERVRYLMDKCAIAPRRICCVTFTNKAADEMRSRLFSINKNSPTNSEPRISTIHSLALSAIRKNPTGFGLQPKVSPLDDYDQHQMVKKIIEREKIADTNPYAALEKIQFHRARGVGFRKDYTEGIAEEAERMYGGYHAMNETDLRLWGLYEGEKTCHPPGELIDIVVEPSRFPRKGERFFVRAKIKSKAIETLKDGELAVSWRKKDARTVYAGRPIKVASRHYCGELTTVFSGGKSTRVTYDHQFWVRFNDNIRGKYLVYMMFRRDFGFRIGITKFKKKANAGLSMRMNGEGAEKSWILKVCNTRFEAQTWEQVYSFKYGIPQTVFNPSEALQDSYNTLVAAVYAAADPESARRCLRDLGLFEECPFLQKGAGFEYSQTCGRFFKVAACNLIAGAMSLPAVTRPAWSREGKQHSWRVPQGIPIDSLSKEQYSGKVYSLDVETDHTYIANGIVVGNCTNTIDFDDMILLCNRRFATDETWKCRIQAMWDCVLVDEVQDISKIQWQFIEGLLAPDNFNLFVVGDLNQSIYSFTGAAPYLLKQYSENWRGVVPRMYKIARNHRSVPEIVALANAVQLRMTNSIPLKMESWRGINGEHGKIEILRGIMPQDVAASIASEIFRDNEKFLHDAATVEKGGKVRVSSAKPISYRENCLAGTTRVLIRGRGFSPLADNVGSATVLNSNREWVPAEIRKFSKRVLRKVSLTVTNNNRKIDIFSTPDHRWELIDGSEKSTDELQRGDRLPFVAYRRKENYSSVDYLLGVRHGLIYGDGSVLAFSNETTPRYKLNGRPVRACKRVLGYKIRICGDAEDLLPYFSRYPMTPHSSGDPIVYLNDDFAATHDLKRLPPEDETEDYLVGFFRGWLAADGTLGKTCSPTICCGPQEEEWLRRVMPNFGYYFAGIYEYKKRQIVINGKKCKRRKRSRNVSIFRKCLRSEDFIISRKRKIFSSYSRPNFVSVCSVEKTNRKEETYCAIVPSTQDFVIEDGVLTGNCILVRAAIQVRDLEAELVRRRIPYVVRGGRGLLQTEEVRDILAYMRLATNHKDFMAFVRAAQVPKRGCGEVALEKIREFANARYDGDLIEAAMVDKNARVAGFGGIVKIVSQFSDAPCTMLQQVLEHTKYTDYVKDKYKKDSAKVKTKLENLERFASLIEGLVEEGSMTAEDMIFQLTLDRPKDDDESGAVTISTIHSAKGLEWKRIYLTNITEGSLPHQFATTPDEWEEERRLFYVACTRARDYLILCVPEMGQRGPNTIMLKPSRFLEEIRVK